MQTKTSTVSISFKALKKTFGFLSKKEQCPVLDIIMLWTFWWKIILKSQHHSKK